MKKYFFVVLLLISLLVIGCKKSAKKEITCVLDWTPNTDHTGLYVAQAKGFFEAQGLSVQIVQPPEDGSALMTASGKAQFGIAFGAAFGVASASGLRLSCLVKFLKAAFGLYCFSQPLILRSYNL